MLQLGTFIEPLAAPPFKQGRSPDVSSSGIAGKMKQRASGSRAQESRAPPAHSNHDWEEIGHGSARVGAIWSHLLAPDSRAPTTLRRDSACIPVRCRRRNPNAVRAANKAGPESCFSMRLAEPQAAPRFFGLPGQKFPDRAKFTQARHPAAERLQKRAERHGLNSVSQHIQRRKPLPACDRRKNGAHPLAGELLEAEVRRSK